MTDINLSVERMRADLVMLVDQYRALTGLADSTVSRQIVGRNDSDFVRRLRAGDNVTTAKAALFEARLRMLLADLRDSANKA